MVGMGGRKWEGRSCEFSGEYTRELAAPAEKAHLVRWRNWSAGFRHSTCGIEGEEGAVAVLEDITSREGNTRLAVPGCCMQ